MKKNLLVASAILMIAIAFTGCLSTPADENNFEDWGTPENSVLIYGSIVEATNLVFSQMDPEYPADYQQAKLAWSSAFSIPTFYLKPVAPGSRYNLVYMYYTVSTGQYVYYYNVYGPLNGTIYDFAVPTKPGLYYYGTLSAQASSAKGEKTFPVISLVNEEQARKNCLKALSKKLEGTAWEQVILDELEAIK
ncbi:MAG: hypothetical protein K6G52_03260 [Treponemataceae bacterium]|nr:hypothetical protein [Treponemataceae bacterium]